MAEQMKQEATGKAIPAGYQQTEVGVIPEDWEVVAVSDVISEISMGPFGSDIKVSNFVKSGVPVLSGINVASSKLVDSFSNFVTNKKAIELKKAVASRGDVVVTHRGTIGQISYIPDDSLFDGYVVSQSQFRVRFNKKTLPAWVVLYFLSPAGSAKLLEGKGHTGVPAIAQATTTFRKLKFPLPSLEEQTAIANVLSDSDALIDALEQLIAKKQAIKNATMQQLLTGRTRLPAFALRPDGTPKGYKPSELGDIPDDWEEISIGQYAVLKARIGWQALTTKEYQVSGDIYLVTGIDFDAGAVMWDKCCYVSEWRYKQDTNIQLRENDVLITKDGTVGKVGYVSALEKPATLNSGVFVIRPKNNSFVPRYLFYVLTSRLFNDFMNQITAGSTITHLYQKDFVNFEFSAPNIEEQTAIATILSDMDNELQALTQKLEKARALKQGMMQQLLTGKIRLPLAAGA
ncbi:restriction endonuclease subunit S [Aeromonas veronii]